MPEMNFVTTGAGDATGAKSEVQQPWYAITSPGYDYAGGLNSAGGSGFFEFGTGTPGSLPFKVDQNGNVTVNSTTVTGGTIITPTFGNGTAATLTDTTRDYMVYLAVTQPGTAFTLAIGPTSGVAGTIVSAAGSAYLGSLYSVRLPAAWYLEWAGSSVTVRQTAIGL